MSVPTTLDPSLPGLGRALSATPPGAASDERYRVRHVDWSPRRHCRVVHQVCDGRRTWFVAHEVTGRGTATREMCPDPGLPGLSAALDAGQVRERLAAVTPGVLDEAVVPVAYRPGSRAVVAYDLRGPDGGSRLFAKVLAEGAAAGAAAGAAIAAAARGRGVAVPVPQVLALWPELGAVVTRAAPGRSLSRVLTDPEVPVEDRVDAVQRLGRLLAGVHATPAGAEPFWTAHHTLAQLEGLLAPAWHADPAVGRSLAALLDRLAERAPGAGELVLAHGAFRTGQVLVDRGRLCLVDLDTVSRSHPARDIGNALAYLVWAEVRGAVAAGPAAALRHALLAGYTTARDRPDDRTLNWWTAAAMAKIAGRRYRSLAVAEWPGVPVLLARAAELLDPAPRRRGAGAADPGPPDAAQLTEILRAVLPESGADARVVETRSLGAAPGRRRVLRYLVEGLGAEGPTSLIGKVYAARHRSFVAHENLRLLGAEVFAATPGLGVPRLLCRIPDLRMVLYREVAGRAADTLDGPDAVRAAETAGRWLATLHASSAVLTRRADLAHELADAAEWATRVGTAVPDAKRSAFALVDRLNAAAAALPDTREVPLHRDLHLGHVLVPPGGGGEVVVLDLDEARMGDPAADVAHACAYLDASCRPDARALRAAFLTGYGTLPGTECDLRLAVHGGYAQLKIAKQLVTGSGPVRPRAEALDSALARGWACLGG